VQSFAKAATFEEHQPRTNRVPRLNAATLMVPLSVTDASGRMSRRAERERRVDREHGPMLFL